MGIFKDISTKVALYKHLEKKPIDVSLNDRLLHFMRHPGLLSSSTLNVIVDEYRQSLPIWDGPTDCPYVLGYHKEILLSALAYAMDSHNRRASYTLAEVLSDSGSALEVAAIARERKDARIAKVVIDMSKLRRDIIKENSVLVKEKYGTLPYTTERALSHFEEVYLTVKRTLTELLPATH